LNKPKSTKAITTIPDKPEIYVRRFGDIHQKKYTIEQIDKFADDLYAWFEDDLNHYKICDWLVQPEIMLNKMRMLSFCKQSEYFNFIYNQIKLIQENRLVDYLVVSDKPTALIFMLKNIAKWRDNPEPEESDEKSKAVVNIDEPNKTV
jgi:hypothetical protein